MMDRTIEEMMLEMEEDEANIQAHPCCANCLYCMSGIPGKHYCEKDNHQFTEEEEYNLVDIGCTLWRSEISGMPCKDNVFDYEGSSQEWDATH